MKLGVNFLIRVLPFAGQQPVNSDFSGVRMRGVFEQVDASLAWTDKCALLKPAGVEKFYRKSLFRRVFDIGHKKGDVKFPGGEPVNHLPFVARVGEIHLAEKSFNELGSEVGMVVEKPQRVSHGAHTADIVRDDLSLPLWIEEIPVRLDFLRIDQLGVGKRSRRRA